MSFAVIIPSLFQNSRDKKPKPKEHDILTVDGLIEDLQRYKKNYGGDIPVVYATDVKGGRFNFAEDNPKAIFAGIMFFAGNPEKNRHDYTLHPISKEEHEDERIESFVAVVIN